MKEINSFRGEYEFLSNFYIHPILFEGMWYRASENAYQAAKTMNREIRQKFVKLTPGKAKELGRMAPLRPGWDKMKDDIMLMILRIKFHPDTDLAIKLLGTKPARLVEGNWWGDEYWGVCNGVGKNRLGELLMKVRDEIAAVSQAEFKASLDYRDDALAQSVRNVIREKK